MHFKTFNNRRLFLKIIKNNLKLKLRNYHIHDELLYVNKRLYVSNVLKLRIKIIKNIYDISLKNHVDRFFIYNRLNKHYY